MTKGYEGFGKAGNLDFARWGGLGAVVWLEPKLGTNTGTESTYRLLEKMDERTHEMKGREIES